MTTAAANQVAGSEPQAGRDTAGLSQTLSVSQLMNESRLLFSTPSGVSGMNRVYSTPSYLLGKGFRSFFFAC